MKNKSGYNLTVTSIHVMNIFRSKLAPWDGSGYFTFDAIARFISSAMNVLQA